MATEPPSLRPMRPDEAVAVRALAKAAFEDLARRNDVTLGEEDAYDAEGARAEHIARTHSAGAWVEESGGGLGGAALAVRQEGVWGLALLVVRPDRQSAGVGRALLTQALASAEGAAGAIILASRDWRGVRLYAQAGFTLEPSMAAEGIPRDVVAPRSVREGSAADLELTAAVDRVARGGARAADLAVELANGGRLLVCEERGYVVVEGNRVETLAALDEAAAADLLRAAMAGATGNFELEGLTARQPWAVREVLAAGLRIAPQGPHLLRGDLGPFAPYLPSGTWL